MPINSPVLLGNRLPQSLPEPQKVDNNSWNQVSAFNNFTSGIQSNSLLYAWGTNNVYQAGDGTTANKSLPTQISSSSFTLVSSGFDHSAAITIDQNLFVWGNNTSTLVYTPFVSWSVIARAGSSAIGIRDDGKLYTWGSNSFGQIGDGTTLNRSSPVQIGNSNWSAVATGELTSIAITSDGRLFAWGYNAQGMVGDNTVIGKSSPVQITAAGVSSWTSISAGYRTAYAIDNTGKLFGWGLNTSYQIGDTTQISKSNPVQIATGTSWTQVSSGADHVVAIDTTGQAYIWGNFASAFAPIPTTIYSWTVLSAGGQHTTGIDNLNLLYTWGQNTVGQLGDGTTLNKSSPVQIGNASYSQISSNYSHSLALKSDGTVWVWGLNIAGQLGNNATINRSSPIQLGAVTNYSFVNVGASNSLAIDSLGQLFIWGDNSAGQLGQLSTVSRSSPTQLGNLFSLTDTSSYVWPIQQNAVSLSTSITPSLSGTPVSLYFNGSTSVYNPGSITVTQLSDGRQSTTEMWVRFDDLGVNRTLFMLSWRGGTISADGTAGILVTRNANNGFNVWTAQGSANQTTSASSNNLITSTSTWYHIAVQIYFSGCDIYLNGTRVATGLAIRWPQRFGSDNNCDITIGSGTAGGSTNPASGSNFLGYISNVRICKDLNVYSGASFTVPTAPLPVTQSSSTNISAITSGQVITLIATDTSSVLNAIPVSWSQASSGSRFTVALKPDSSLWTWGLNSSGQLGQVFSPYPAGHTFNRSSPVQIGTDSWLQINAGFDHVLAIRSDYTLWTWGNYLAVGLVSTPISWQFVAGGATHTLGIDNQGKLYAWGTNAQGQLGVLDAVPRSSPTQVSGLLSWNSVSAGNSFSLGINNTNQLYAWGLNTSGQVGDNTSLNKSSPVLIATGSWSQVHAGFDHSMAIRSDNILFGWGGFAGGQLGIQPFSSWRQIAAGLAIRADNTLWSWGSYPGDNTTNVRSSPIQIGTSDWVSIANNFDSAANKAAITINGSLWMWGDNSAGQLGQNDTINRSSPVQVAGSWSQVDIKQSFAAAINSSGILFTWGNNVAGQLGDNTTISKSSPVLLASPFNTTSWNTVTVGETHAAALRSDRIMYTWGLNNFGQLGTNSTINRSNPTLLASPFDTTSWGMVSAGATHVIALRATGSTIVVFGRDNFGQTGITVGINRSLPTQIGTDSWVAVSAGPNSTYGIIGSPTFYMYAWGLNTSGQLGLNDTNSRFAPTVNGGLSWNAVGPGYAIDVTGRTFIWGPTNSGLSSFNFNVSSPVQVNAYGPIFYAPIQIGSNSWTSVDTGNSYTVAISSDGLLYAWGLNNLGQYGNQTTISRSSPVLVNSFSWNAVAAGFDHVLAIRNDTTLWTWGNSNAILVPVTPQSFTAIAAGESTTLAIRNDGKLFAWGYGSTGTSLGDGTTINRSSPVAIGGTSSFTAVYAIANTFYAKGVDNILNVWGFGTSGQTGTGQLINRSQITQIGLTYTDGSSYNNITESYGTGYNTEVIPFASTASNFFNRSNYITVLYNPDIALWGDNDYMCEMWVNPVVLEASVSYAAPLQIGNVSPSAITIGWVFGFNATGRLMLFYTTVASGTQTVLSNAPYNVGVNQWQHIAFTHTIATGVIRLYLNGIIVATATRVGTQSASTLVPITIGAANGNYFNGYISNLRIVKGNVVYTNNFAPPTSPLTATQSASTNTNAIIAGETRLLLFNNPANFVNSNYTLDANGKGNHTLALKPDNTLWAWGSSTTGETGVIDITYSWAQVAGGLALRTDNTLWSWMQYPGNNTNATISSPIQIGTNEWSSISLIHNSLYVKAAIKTDGTLWMWGDNSTGQLGQNDTINRSSPVQVSGSWNQVSVQFSHTAALDSTNIMYVWGNNAFGQLGTNDTINRSSPVLLASPFNTTSWSFVGVGYSHTTALRSDAIVYSWGNNAGGQLGDNTTISKSNPVLLASGFATFSWNQISVGALHTLARRNNNLLYSWGSNSSLQLGDTSSINRSSPVQIGASSWIHVTAGRISSFGITVFGALFAWGNNSSGELGLNDVTNRNSPVQIGALTSFRLTGVQSAIDNFGRAFIWGGSGSAAGSQSGLLDTAVVNSSPVQVGGFRYPINKYYAPQQLGTSSWLQIASGLSFSVAIDANNRLFGWGLNSLGQLGDQTTINKSSPVQVISGSWLYVSAGLNHVIAVRSDTTLWTWGNFNATFQNILPTSWSSISAGISHSLAIRSDGKLFAWGLGTSGQLGTNATQSLSSPVVVGAPATNAIGILTNVGLSSWSVVSAGLNYSLAIDVNNNLYAWGLNDTTNFQFGDPWGVSRSTPVQISLGIRDTSSYTQDTYSYDVPTTTAIVPPLSGNPVSGTFGFNLAIPSYVHLETAFPIRLETNDFTVECWINWQGSTSFVASAIYTIISNRNTTDTNYWELVYVGQTGFRWASLGGAGVNFSTGLFANQWYHIAAVRISGTVTLYLDGVNVASGSQPGRLSTVAPLRVGYVGTQSYWIGYISNVRIVNGLGVYTGNFTVPTSVLTATQSSGTNIQAITSGQTALLLLTDTTSVIQSTFTDISAGDTHGFAEQSNGVVYGWGNNNVGQVEPWGEFPSWNMVSASVGFNGTGIAIRNADKALLVWGLNQNGQLGISDTINRSSPVQLGANSWLQVNTQGASTAAIRIDNTLWTWGAGAGGKLAQNDVVNRSSPTQVAGSWTSVTIGPKIAAAIKTDGTLWIWGDNPDGTTVQRSSPVQVSGSWSQVTTGNEHILAIDNLGILYAWGRNDSGQLGDGTTIRKSTPTPLATPFATTSFTKVAAGLSNSLAIATDGTLYVWGGNSVGELGLNSTITRSNPIAIGFTGTNYGSWTAIAAGSQTGIGIANNNVYVWGNAANGVYGDNLVVTRSFPLQVNIGYSWTNVSIDVSNAGVAAFTRSDGALFVTGLNTNGGLADGTTVTRSNPVLIGARFTQLVRTPMRVGTSSWLQVRAGTSFTVGINSIGELYAWGLNNNTQIGVNTTINRNDAIVKITGSSWTSISAGNSHSMAIRSDGTIWTWGGATAIGLSNVTPNSWSQIAPSSSTSNMAAIRSDGTLFVWGNNNIGQVGDGTTINKSSPTQIGNNTNWSEVELGESFAVARTTNGFIWAWGLNTTGQLGDGTTFNRSSPIQVGNRSYSTVSAGSSYAFGISGNDLYAWGINSAGQLGDNTTINKSSPVLVSGPVQILTGLRASWSAISAGTSHTVAIDNVGTLFAWGNNSVFQVGDNTTANKSNPVQISTSFSFVSVSSGANHTLALTNLGKVYTWGQFLSVGTDVNSWTMISYNDLGSHAVAVRSDGQLYAWGLNTSGQLGTNDAVFRSSPVLVSSSQSFNFVAAGNASSYAITQQGVLYAWGLNSSGQLGDNTIVTRSTPIQVQALNQVVLLTLQSSTYIDNSNYKNTLIPAGLTTAPTITTGPSYVGNTVLFNGLQQRITIPYQTTFNYHSYTSWTFECFVYLTAMPSINFSVIAGRSWVAGFSGPIWGLQIHSTGYIQWAGPNGFASGISAQTSAGVITTNTWYHLAFVKTINNLAQIYVNGVLQDSRTSDGPAVSGSGDIIIGNYSNFATVLPSNDGQFVGYMSDIRITQGTSVYTGAFTTPTRPLTNTQSASTNISALGYSSFTSVTAGGSHVVAIANGDLYSWGNNSTGQLGVQNTINRSSPVLLESGSLLSFTQISAEGNYTLAVNSAGILYAWGQNANYNFGDSTSVNRSNLMQIGRSGFSQISAGLSHAGGITTAGRLQVWGQATAVLIPTTQQSYTQVRRGQLMGVALRNDGAIFTWGQNGSGNLGDGTTINKSSPVQVANPHPFVTSWTQIAGGHTHCVAVANDGKAYGWGLNTSGQLGDSTVASKSTPVFIPAYSSFAVTDLSSYSATPTNTNSPSFILDNTLFLGAAAVTTSRTTGSTVTYPASANYAMTGDFTIEFWVMATGRGGGEDISLSLGGTGNTWEFSLGTASPTPFVFRFVDNTPTTISLTTPSTSNNLWYHVAVVRIDSTISLFLNGMYYQAATYSGTVGNSNGSLSLAKTTGAGTGANQNIANIRIINGTGIYQRRALSTAALDFPSFTSPREPLEIVNTTQTVFLAATSISRISTPAVVSVSVGSSHSAIVLSDGSLYTFGGNGNGQLGDGTVTNRLVPTKIGSSSWTQVSCGLLITGAITSASKLFMWGSGTNNTLGANTFTIQAPRSSPTQIGLGASWTQVACGWSHSAGIDSSGYLYVWGGINAVYLPQKVVSWSVISSSVNNFSVAIRDDGTLWTWGTNTSGTLGDGTTVNKSSPSVIGNDSYVAVSAGANHVAAINWEGKLFTWGLGTSGQLGNNAILSRSSPVQVAGTTSFSQVSAGGDFTVALTNTNLLFTWGLGTTGQLGIGLTTNRSSPVPVGSSSWTSISAGGLHALAVASDGLAYVWGSNATGQLGIGVTLNRSSPVQLSASTSWVSVSAGGSHSVAIRDDYGLFAWGLNNAGQLGNNTTINRSSPVQIGTESWTQVSAASSNTQAIRSDGTLWGWGLNTSNQLGDNTIVNKSSPVQISGGGSWNQIAYGFALRGAPNSNLLATWGIGTNGRTGLGETTNRAVPVNVGSVGTRDITNSVAFVPEKVNYSSYTQVSVGIGWTMVIDTLNRMWGWGNDGLNIGAGGTGAIISPLTQIGTSSWTQVFYGNAVRIDGTLWGWGSNPNFNIGDLSTTNRVSPVLVGTTGGNVYTAFLTGGEYTPVTIGASSWSQISVGTSVTMALRADSTLFTWGYNAQGQLGLADAVNRSSPVQVFGGMKYSFIQAGLSNAFAISSSKGYQNKLFAWGNNAGALLGFGDQTNRNVPTLLLPSTGSVIPSAVLNDLSFNQVSAGVSYSIIRRSVDNAVMGWNQNSVGQLGDLSLVQFGRSNPTLVGAPADADNSIQRAIPTLSSGAKPVDFSPFASQPYDTTTIGGSVNFDAVGSGVSYPYTTLYDILTNDVSVEVWAYWNTFNTAVSYMTLFGQNSSTASTVRIQSQRTTNVANGTVIYTINNDTNRGAWPIETNTWYHLVVTCTSGVSRFFVNGALVGYASGIGSIGARNEAWSFGGEDTGRFDGFMSNFRLVIGEIPATYQTTNILGAIDQSSFNATITDVNSAVTYSTAVIPFAGATAAYFIGNATRVGSNSYLTIPNAAGFQFGTGDFTVEFWMRKDTTYQSGTIMGLNTASIGNWGVIMSGGFFYWQNGFTVSTLGPNLSINTYFPIDTWVHVAIVKISGTINIYIGGTSVASYADTTNYNGTGILNIGSTSTQPYGPLEGYLSNLRIVKGVGVYTGNFTVPTSPLTTTQSAGTNINAITGTQTSLLIFTTPASAGTPGVQIFTPPTSPLTQTSQGISSALSTRLLALQGFSRSYNNIAATGRVSSFVDNGKLFTTGIGTTGEQGDQSATTRSTVTQLGSVFTGVNLGFNVPVQVTIGSWSQVRAGWSSSAALRNDGTVWTWGLNTSGQLGTRTAITRSTPVQVTTLSTTFIDNSSNNQTLTTVATEASMVIFSPFATVPYDASTLGGAGYFANGYLTLASNVVLAMSTGDFTCEAWIYITDFSATWRSIFSTRASSSTVGSTVVWALGVNNTGYLYFYSGAFQTAGATGVISINQWYHVAVTRASNSMRLFVDGVQTGSTTTTSQNYTTQTATIGANGDGSERFYGYISNLRLVKGQALYTSTFTPSTSPLTTTSQGATAGNVSLLTCGSFASTIPTTMDQVSIGSSFTFSRQTNDASLFAWGLNTGAQIGINDLVNRSSPTAINSEQYLNTYTISPVQVTPSTSNYSQVYAGYSYSFVRTATGDLYAWGLNSSGQLGLMDAQPYVLNNRSNPTLVNNSNYYRVLDVSNNNYIIRSINVLTKSTAIVPLLGSVSLTGFGSGKIMNLLGADNVGFTAYFSSAYTIEFWVYITSYANQIFCAYDDTSRVNIFTNTNTGLFSFTTEATVLTESATPQFSLNTWIHVALVRLSSVVRLYRNGVYTNATVASATNYSGGTTFSIGTNNSGTVPLNGYISNFRVANVGIYTGNFTVPTSILTATQSAGTNISALTGNQVGLLTLTTEAATIQPTFYDYTSIATGNAFTAGVLSSNDNIQGVGAQSLGSLGLGDTITRSNPVIVGSIPILNAYTTSPVQVNIGTSNYTQIFAGQSFSVAKNSSNQYFVWGLNTSGQLGLGNTITRSSPTLLGLSSFVQVSAGYTHLMSIDATNNYLQATGLNSSGQLGLSDTGQRNSFVVVGSTGLNFGTLSPLQVGANLGFSWTSVSAGQSFSLAERSDGTLYGWGLNTVGQIDNNTTISRSSPTLIGSTPTFIDQSIYNKPYINLGVAIETSIRPFAGAVSAYFNGSAQTTLFFTWDNTLNIGTTFSIEGWIYPISSNGAIFSYIGASGGVWPSYELWMNAGSLALRGASSSGAGSADVGVALGTPTLNQWSYFVVRWLAGAFVGYLNGTQTGGGSTGASPYNLSDGGLRFGLSQGINANGYFTGYISNIRIIKGSQGYVGTPTNPTGVLPLVQNATATQAAITEGQVSLFLFTNTSSIANNVTSSFSLISAGQSHAAATYANNNLYIWGLNSSGQLGDNTTLNKVSPVLVGNYLNTATISPVLALSGSWKSVSGGVSHSMAIRSDDTLWIWGLNNVGQAGQGSPLLNYSSPVQISGSWSLISAGLSYNLATDMNGILYAWGLGTSNQLGISSATSRSSPTVVSSSISFSQITAGFASQASYGLDISNLYYVWGGNGNFLLGIGSNAEPSIAAPRLMQGINWNTTSPTLVNGNWSTVSAGFSHTGGIIASSLYMWGLNSSGQLGLGNTILRSSPTLVGATIGISDGSANNYAATVIGSPVVDIVQTPLVGSPSIYFNGSSRLTYADAINLQFGTSAFTIEAFIRLDTVSTQDTIIAKGGQPIAGYSFHVLNGSLRFMILSTSYVHPTALSANIWYHVAVTRDSSNDLRVFLNGVSSGILVNTAYDFNQTDLLNIATSRTGTLELTGYISNLRVVKGTALYTANFTPPTTPLTAVSGTQLLLANSIPTNLYKSVYAGLQSTYGIQSNDSLYAWGNGAAGEISGYFGTITRSNPILIGNDFISINQSSPVPIALGSWTKVSAGNSVSAALRSDGGLFTWGSLNTSGQLGLNTTVGRSSPTQIGSSSWTQVSAYDTHMIALTQPGSAFTWGLNASGQLGLTNINAAGDTINRSNPTLIGPILNVLDVSDYSGTIQVNGSSYSTAIVPFAGAVAGYFNGTTDYLTVTTLGANTNLGTGDFTAECWFYGIRINGNDVFFSYGNYYSELGFGFGLYLSTIRVVLYSGGNSTTVTPIITVSITANTWYHVALVRISGTFSVYLNGVLQGTLTPSTRTFNTNFGIRIGSGDYFDSGFAPYYWFNGYVSNVRLVKGVGVYTGNFTVPTSVLTKSQSSGTNISSISASQTSLLTYTTQAATISGGVPTYFNSVAAGSSFTGGITTTGSLFMWGLGASGQLGSNSTIARSSPVAIGGTSSYSLVTAGSVNAMALRPDSSLYVWGIAGAQQARIWGTPVNLSSPVQIGNQYAGQGLSYTQIPFLVYPGSWKAVDAGNSITSAISSQDRLFAWGLNATGQIDGNNTINRSSPTQIGQNLYLQTSAGVSNMGVIGKAT